MRGACATRRDTVAFAKHSAEMRLALEAVSGGNGGDAQGAPHGIRQRPCRLFDTAPLDITRHGVRFPTEYHVQIASRDAEGVGHGGGCQIRIVEIAFNVIADLHP